MELYECVNFILESTRNSVYAYFKGKLTAFDVTPIQYALLKCLWKTDMQTPSQLAQTLRIDASTTTGVVERLERKNLVERVYSKTDRRSVHVCLTQSGAALQPGVEAAILEANREVLADFTEEEAVLFKQMCLRARDTAAKIRENS
jgi:DNA-binding MarR family transcriptional regulator